LGILPEGLTSIEWRILNILRRDGRSSLQSLCAKTGLSRSSLQREHENYLLSKGLMEIDGQRVITKKGNDLIYNNM
jgi:Holliday junction resolvasome RuvABC ATP-dependent DNA helicase subunit